MKNFFCSFKLNLHSHDCVFYYFFDIGLSAAQSNHSIQNTTKIRQTTAIIIMQEMNNEEEEDDED